MRSIISFLLLFLSFKLTAQEINGLGNLKLLSTTVGFIDTLKKEGKSFTQLDEHSSSLIVTALYDIIEFIPNKDPSKSPFPVSYVPDTRIFRIYNYKLLGRYNLSTLTLTYSKNLLIVIDVDQPEELLINDISEKYGKPKSDYNERLSECADKKSRIIRDEWGIDSENRIDRNYGINYSKNCKGFEINSLHVYNYKSYVEYIKNQNDFELKIKNMSKSKILSDL